MRDEINCISDRLRHDIISDIPDLAEAANYYFKVLQPWRMLDILNGQEDGMVRGACGAKSSRS